MRENLRRWSPDLSAWMDVPRATPRPVSMPRAYRPGWSSRWAATVLQQAWMGMVPSLQMRGNSAKGCVGFSNTIATGVNAVSQEEQAKARAYIPTPEVGLAGRPSSRRRWVRVAGLVPGGECSWCHFTSRGLLFAVWEAMFAKAGIGREAGGTTAALGFVAARPSVGRLPVRATSLSCSHPPHARRDVRLATESGPPPLLVS